MLLTKGILHLTSLFVGPGVFAFVCFEMVLLFCKQNGGGERGARVFLNPHTVCLLNEPAAVATTLLPAHKHAPSDLTTMSRLCKHLIITIKLSINLHYGSLFKREPTFPLA